MNSLLLPYSPPEFAALAAAHPRGSMGGGGKPPVSYPRPRLRQLPLTLWSFNLGTVLRRW